VGYLIMQGFEVGFITLPLVIYCKGRLGRMLDRPSNPVPDVVCEFFISSGDDFDNVFVDQASVPRRRLATPALPKVEAIVDDARPSGKKQDASPPCGSQRARVGHAREKLRQPGAAGAGADGENAPRRLRYSPLEAKDRIARNETVTTPSSLAV